MGKFQHTCIAGLLVLACNAQTITIQLDDKMDSIPISKVINRVGEIRIDELRFKLAVWGSYTGNVKHLVIRDKTGTYGHQQTIKQKDGVLVYFRRRIRKLPIITKEVKLLKQKQWKQKTKNS